MKFDKFASLLHPIIGEGSSTHKFCRTLFDAIITEENSDILNSYSQNTFKAYFNGKTSIVKISQKILAFIEPEQFKSYIEGFSDATAENLCTAFRDEFPDIDLHNASEKITALFVAIIMESAATKKKGYSPKEEQRKNEIHKKLEQKLLATGAAIAETWTSLVANLVFEDDEPTKEAEAEVEGDTTSPGAAEKTESKVQIIENATVVNQYGENCVHIDHVDTFKL